MIELEEEMESLRHENRQLREQNEDLHAQLLHDSVERGRSLLAEGQPSLLEELNGKDTIEVIKMHTFSKTKFLANERAERARNVQSEIARLYQRNFDTGHHNAPRNFGDKRRRA